MSEMTDTEAGTPLTAEGECGYECPFTREGHAFHEVDHEFEPRPATDPAGLDAAMRAVPIHRFADTEDNFDAEGYRDALIAAARLSVADGPGPEVDALAAALHETAPHNHNLGEGLARAICKSVESHRRRAEAILAALGK